MNTIADANLVLSQASIAQSDEELLNKAAIKRAKEKERKALYRKNLSPERVLSINESRRKSYAIEKNRSSINLIPQKKARKKWATLYWIYSIWNIIKDIMI